MNTSTSLTITSKYKTNIVISWIVGFIALGAAGWLGSFLRTELDFGYTTSMFAQAATMSGIIVLGIWFLRTQRKLNLSYKIGLGTPVKAMVQFISGMGILLLPVFLSILGVVLFDWGEVNFNWDAGASNSVLIGLLIVFTFEAFPEELLFRGYLFSTLNVRFKKWQAALLTVGLFVLLPLLLTPFQQHVLGMETNVGGSQNVQLGYIIILALFGSFVQYLRVLTNTIWTGIGFHLMFVFMNRLIGTDSNSVISFTGMTDEGPLKFIYAGSLLVIFAILILYPIIKKRSLHWNALNRH
jgi:membrane protease YdiL (CAAX protease family)